MPLSRKISPATDRPRLVHYRTLAWTASTNDFEPVAGRVLVPAGATTGAVTITVRADPTVESDEVFLVEFRNGRRSRGTRAFSVVTIVAPVRLSP